MKNESKELAQVRKPKAPISIYQNADTFAQAQKMALSLVESDLVPPQYQAGAIGQKKAVANCLIALDVAQRAQMSPMMIMQNLDIIGARPSFRSVFLGALINESGKYSTVRHEMATNGKKDVKYTTWEGPKGNRRPVQKQRSINDIKCRAHCTDLNTGEVLKGPWVTIEMAILEGWYDRNGSKWPTMPEVMLRYRATSFWCRQYEPGATLGIRTRDEVEDEVLTTPAETMDVEHEEIIELNKNSTNDEPPTTNQPEPEGPIETATLQPSQPENREPEPEGPKPNTDESATDGEEGDLI